MVFSWRWGHGAGVVRLVEHITGARAAASGIPRDAAFKVPGAVASVCKSGAATRTSSKHFVAGAID